MGTKIKCSYYHEICSRCIKWQYLISIKKGLKKQANVSILWNINYGND